MHTLTLSSADATKTVDVTVEIADTPKEREKGLMYRENLDQDHGMLFAFKEPQMLSFWMRNTKIPLEIMFFDERGRFINAYEMQPCTQEPCPTYDSEEVAQYALEVSKNFRVDHGIGVGWTMDLKQVNQVARPE